MALLLTGANGFVGMHFAATASCVPLADGDGPIDLLDEARITEFIAAARPDAVVHLAGQTSVPEAFRDPRGTIEVNLLGTLNLLQGLKASAFAGRLLHVSTGDVYGPVADDSLPITERHPPNPQNPYAVSKIAAEALCHQWWSSEGFDIVVARPFNHVGFGQSDRFVLSRAARQIAEIRRQGGKGQIVLGNLETSRDFTDVRDIIAAYHLLLAKGRSGAVYNVCSGLERKIVDAVERMAQLADVEIEIVSDPSLMRATDQVRVAGSNQLIAEEVGWSPATDWDDTLAELLRTWS